MTNEASLLLLVNLGTLLILSLQLAVLRRQVTAAQRQVGEAQRTRVEDHRRRRMQATLEAYTATRELRAELRRRIEQAVGPGEMSSEMVRQLIAEREKGDARARDAVYSLRDYLNVLESLAVGANMGVYDKDVLRRLGRAHLTRTLSWFRPYIDWRRAEFSPRAYADLEGLVLEFNMEQPNR